jgi:site-specific recombinase XerD
MEAIMLAQGQLATAVEVGEVHEMMEWRGEFEDYLVQRGLRRNSIFATLRDLAVFDRWFERINGQRLQPGLVTGVDLRLWRANSLDEEGVKPATWNRRRASLRAFTSWALERGDLAYDPFVDVARAEQVARPPRWLDDRELHAFTRVMEAGVLRPGSVFGQWKACRDAAMTGLMLWAGLREGEVAALDRGDITLGERSGKAVIRQGKGGKRREVPLGREARHALRRWNEARGEHGGALFTNKRGDRVGVNAIQEAVKELGRLAKVAVTPHALRHTFAKRLVDRGAALTVVADLLGHAAIETTRVYARPGWQDLEEAVEG